MVLCSLLIQLVDRRQLGIVPKWMLTMCTQSECLQCVSEKDVIERTATRAATLAILQMWMPKKLLIQSVWVHSRGLRPTKAREKPSDNSYR